MPARATLPPELCDETIDHLWDDVRALQACSLTCRAWLPASRLHLFRNIRLRSAADVSRFRALLASAPDAAHLVRRLSLSADYGADGREDDGWVNDAAELVPRLARVETLALARVRWHALQPGAREAFAGVFRAVRTLFLFEVSFAASGDVLAFLAGFPALQELYFQAVSWKVDSPAPGEGEAEMREVGTGVVPPPPGGMQLTYLFLDPKSSPTLVTEWLLAHPEEQRLRSIQLCWRELENTQLVGELLHASGAELESLHVEFPKGVSDDAVLQNHLSLAHNTSLRSLYFGGLTLDDAQPLVSQRLFPWVTTMLAQLRSRALDEVSFELALGADGVRGLAALDWPRIDAELAREEFAGLTVRFYVACANEPDEREAKRHISAALEGFKRRGTLCVSCL